MRLTLSIIAICLVQQSEQRQSQLGYHCGNITQPQKTRNGSNSVSGNDTTDLYQCVPCFFPQNCLVNNTCLEGSFGDTCEKCAKTVFNQTVDYHRVGNTCVVCTKIPWSAVAFGVYLLIFVIVCAVNGFSVSVFTKLKILCHLLQLSYLSFMVKVRWSDILHHTMAVLKFSCFNSKIVNIECLFPRWPSIVEHYLEWTTSILVVVALFLVAFFVDRSMGLVLSKEKEESGKDKIWQRRSGFRRWIFFALLMVYMPMAITAIHTFSCSETVPYDVVLDKSRDVFLFEQGDSCDKFVFQTLHFFATVLLIVYVIFFPLMVLLFAIRQRKWSLLEEERVFSGYVYDSYKQRWCFWEAIPMLRKVLYIVVTDTYPLSTFVQSLIQLSVTGIYLLAIIVFRPYRAYNWRCSSEAINIHVIYEVICNIAVGLIQGVALMTTMGMYIPELDYVVISCLGAGVLTGVMFLLIVPLEQQKDQEKIYDTPDDATEEVEVEDAPVGVRGVLRIRKVKVTPSAQAESLKTETKQKNLAF